MATVNLDTATRLDVVCRKNDSFSLELDFGKTMPDSSDVGVTYEFTVRTSTDGSEVGDFEVHTDDANSIGDSMVVVQASNSDMNITQGLYVYDLAVTDGGATKVYPQVDSADRVITLLYGTLKVVDDLS
jgi:hypothetical protein